MPDRYSDSEPAEFHDKDRCPKWLGEDEEGRPIPCLKCKDHLAITRREVYDTSVTEPSARAREAIDRANREDKQWG